MLALRKAATGFGIELSEIEVSLPRGQEVLVAVHAAGICGSDLHAYEWTPGYEFMADLLPVTLGHEFSGIVVSTDKEVTDFVTGDRVTCWPTITCSRCQACLEGRDQNCERRRTIGLHCDGGFAPQVIVPVSNCRKIPDTLSFEMAALTEPLSVAINAVDVAEIEPGAFVVVLGPGPIGLGIASVAMTRGAHVLLAGFEDQARLEIARLMGVPHVADLSEMSLQAAVDQAFGRQVDRVVEATGVSQSVTEGLGILRSGGILVVAGIHSKPVQLELTPFVREKKQIRGAHDTTATAVEEAIRLLTDNGKLFAHLITHRRSLADGLAAFELARGRQAVKVLLMPCGDDLAKDRMASGADAEFERHA